MEILLVDGYNIIGAWKELQQLKQRSLVDSRDRLIEMMADYQAFSGMRVIVVFDAYLVPGRATKLKQHNVEVIFTKSKETADARIERLTNELMNRRTKVYVATSDMTEQNVIFGNGALRKSAREFEIDYLTTQKDISEKVQESVQKIPVRKINISDEVAIKLEEMRRGKF
ncbi:NYN domain-containing protein [Kurthia zopfii]|uniref:NYN domain-containing protein n=1 Tax=Kurthia zopfii TaxID=1650 RepID=UPI000F6B6686|nr:NYN domain-containing protein [Kurthia zopfii]VEI05490.1 Predicted RNA-binding protein containing a PIN domain [Kurthia zopfii]